MNIPQCSEAVEWRIVGRVSTGVPTLRPYSFVLKSLSSLNSAWLFKNCILIADIAQP